MSNTTILRNDSEASARPTKETIRNILNYSRALKVKKLKSGFEFEMISN